MSSPPYGAAIAISVGQKRGEGGFGEKEEEGEKKERRWTERSLSTYYLHGEDLNTDSFCFPNIPSLAFRKTYISTCFANWKKSEEDSLLQRKAKIAFSVCFAMKPSGGCARPELQQWHP